MKKASLLYMICCPFFLFAQKGTIKPDVIPQAPAVISSVPDDIRVWEMEGNLKKCPDSTSKCYIVKENGISITVPQDDVHGFTFEEGFKYTLWVKEEMKTPPVVSNKGIYNYTLVKVVSKRPVLASTSSSSNKSGQPSVPAAGAKDIESRLSEEVELLKSQVSDLKKQVATIQLQLQMQLQLFQKNK